MAESAPPPVANDIATATKRIGAYVWIASRLFEVTGAWSRAEDNPSNKGLFLEINSRFAWIAGEFFNRLPVLREVDRAAVQNVPGDLSGTYIAYLDTLVNDEDRILALMDAVADLDEVFEAHLGQINPVCDGPMQRSIVRVRHELKSIQYDVGSRRQESTQNRPKSRQDAPFSKDFARDLIGSGGTP